MPAFAFDTHAAVKSLTGAGFDTMQAEAITDTLRDAVTESVATKGDVAVLGPRLDRIATRKDLEAFATKADLDAGFASLKADMLKFAFVIVMTVIVSTNIALIIALLTFLGGTN